MRSGKFTMKSIVETLRTKYNLRNLTEHYVGRALRRQKFIKGKQVWIDSSRSWTWFVDQEHFERDERDKDIGGLPVDLASEIEADAEKGDASKG